MKEYSYNAETGLTVERNLTSEEIFEWEMSQQEIEPVFNNYKLYKSKFIERLTNEEASALEIVLNNEEPKLRLMFNSVEFFVSDDPLFAVLHWTLMQELGEERADELLAQET